MVRKKKRVIETIEFKTKEEINEEEIKIVSDKAQKFFEKQSGYEHRMILQNTQNKKWREEVQWRNEDYAKEARKNSKKSEKCKEYYNSINPKTIKMNYFELTKMY